MGVKILSAAILIASVPLGTASAQPTNQLPTATEVFNLRSRCAALAEKFLEENAIGSALTQFQISNYEPRTNRCYVEFTTQAIDPSKLDYHNRTLFDGQTREILAFAKTEKGQKAGMVFDRQHQSTGLTNAGWDDANAYIDKMMTADRRLTPDGKR
jgi:hypothetical protein